MNDKSCTIFIQNIWNNSSSGVLFAWWMYFITDQHLRPVSQSVESHSGESWWWFSFNTLRPRQKLPQFRRWHLQMHFLNETVRISIQISLKFVPKGPINNITALVQIKTWRRPGDKPLSEPMMVRLPMHICDIWVQWVNLCYDQLWGWVSD